MTNIKTIPNLDLKYYLETLIVFNLGWKLPQEDRILISHKIILDNNGVVFECEGLFLQVVTVQVKILV